MTNVDIPLVDGPGAGQKLTVSLDSDNDPPPFVLIYYATEEQVDATVALRPGGVYELVDRKGHDVPWLYRHRSS